MSSYEVRFHVPAEIIVRIDAPDEERAADLAWEYANAHTQSSAMDDSGTGVQVHVSLDGVGADEVEETSR